jgi:23S rRNA (guanosine2251-2'-O)-methyltransferase
MRFGINPVTEALAAGVVIEVLVTGADRPQVATVVRRAMYLHVPVREVAAGDLDRATGGARHQGAAALVRPYNYLTFDALRVLIASASEPPLLVALDGVEDPQNFGAVIRTAEGAGALAVLVGSRNSAPVTAAVARASAGAADRLPVARVESLPTTLALLKRDGFAVIGLDGRANGAYEATDLRGRVAVVAGSEGRGLSRSVAQACDSLVRIPLHGSVASLNVSVAVAVFAFEARVQRRRADGPFGSGDDSARIRPPVGPRAAPQGVSPDGDAAN